MSKLVVEATANTFDDIYEGGYDKRHPSEDLVRLEAWYFGRKPGRALDYGCGPGTNGLYLLDSGYDVVFTDVSPKALGKVRQKLDARALEVAACGRLRLIDPTADTIPDADDTYDNLVCLSVLSNLGSAESVRWAISEFTRVLKPGGKMIIDINGLDSTYVYNGKELGDSVYSTLPHTGYEGDEILMYFPRTKDEFAALVESVPELQVDDIGHTSFAYQNNSGFEYIICAHKAG